MMADDENAPASTGLLNRVSSMVKLPMLMTLARRKTQKWDATLDLEVTDVISAMHSFEELPDTLEETCSLSKQPLLLYSEQKFLNFWGNMHGSSDACTEFVVALMKKLEVHCQHRRCAQGKHFKLCRSGTKASSIGGGRNMNASSGMCQSVESLALEEHTWHIIPSSSIAALNTLVLLGLYHPVKLLKSEIDIMLRNVVPESVIEGNAGGYKEMVWSILKLQQSKTKHFFPLMLNLWASLMSGKFTSQDKRTAVSGWIYIWLQNQFMAMPGQAMNMLQSLVDYLKDDCLRSDEAGFSDEVSIISTLFLLHQIISLTLINEDMLKQIERLLDHYLRWPCPVGFHASEVQKLITKEKKAAGYALMKKLKMLRCAYITNSVPLIINCKSDFYGHLYCNLESSNLNAEDAQKMELFFIIRTLQACGMVSLISGTLGARLKNALGSLPPQGLNDFYNDLLDIMEEASKIEDVRKARKEHKDKIACICKELIDNSETSEISIECEGFPADFSEYRNPSVGFRIQSMHLKWIPTPLRVSNIKAYPYPMPIHVPKTTAQQMLWEIVHNGFAGRQGEPHRVLITSGDGTLQYILTGYVGMMHNKRQMGDLQEVDVRFFVLPAHELDTLSCYIARRDHFYDAMIYRPLTNPLPFIPFIEHVNNKNFLAELTGGSGDVIRMREEAIPCMLLRKQIENYILEGNCLLNITIFNCEGWYTDRGKSFHCTIPFLIRADIALSVGTVVTKHKSASHCQSIPRKSTTSFDNQEMFQNLVSKSTLKASVIYKPVDRNGIEVPERREDYTLLALSAINIPNPSELRLNCDPCNASLNLCIVESDVNSRNGVKTLDDLVRFMVTCHAKFIVVEAERPFDVLLDGLAFGPFMRIRLSACPDPLNMANSLKFPIMSYWPTRMSRHGHL